jgi:ATPase family AAA domain-containing protein 1
MLHTLRNALLIAISAQSSMMYYVARTIVASLPTAVDPEKEQHEQARVKAAANLRRIDRLRGDSDSDDESDRDGRSTRRPRKEDLELDQYENQIAMELVAPEDIPVGFEGILSTWKVFGHQAN